MHPSLRYLYSYPSIRHHHERLHRVLAALLRAGIGAALQHPLTYPLLGVLALLVAGIRQLAPQPHHLRHSQQGLQKTLPGKHERTLFSSK